MTLVRSSGRTKALRRREPQGPAVQSNPLPLSFCPTTCTNGRVEKMREGGEGQEDLEGGEGQEDPPVDSRK